MRQRDEADHVLRAYKYQLLHALQEWLDLRDDQELLLEIDEDHAVVSEEQARSAQVKFSGSAEAPRSISLRSADVKKTIARYWKQSRGGEDARTYLSFLTNRSAAREQAFSGPGAGLTYWNDVAREGNLAPLRELLIEVFRGTPLGTWLESGPADEDVRSRLLRRVDFVLGAPDDAALESHLRDRLGMIYLDMGHHETAGNTALPVLLKQVLDTSSAPEAKLRRLTRGHLQRALEEALPRIGGRILAQLAAGARPATGIGVTALSLRSGLCNRAETVNQLLGGRGPGSVTWLAGANGVGKSTLAKLMARALGGTWLVCDFRPFMGDGDAQGVVPVWHELISALTSGASPDGIILDDLAPRGVELLKNRLAGLAAGIKVRGARIVVTSNFRPSGATLAEIGAGPGAMVDAPYFTVGEVRELVEQPATPAGELIEGWANLIHVSTSAGHPQLVTAKIANLRARGWPNEALLEDLGPEANEGVRDTRAEARRRLLAELPQQGSARDVLERISTVFQSFEDALVHDLCRDAPALQRPGDALALLKGPWLEPAGQGGWRLSPLLSDLSADVPPESATRWRQIAAEYWLMKGTLDGRTLPLCFWNAFFGRHVEVLQTLGHLIMTLPPGQVQSAAAILSPLVACGTDRPLLADQPMTACSLRLLQIVVADAVENEDVASAASAALLREVDAVPVEKFRLLETSVAAKVVLGLERVWIPARLQITYLMRQKATVARVMGGGYADLKRSMEGMTQGLPEGADAAGMLLAGVFMRMQDSGHLWELIDTLGELAAEERVSIIRSVEAVVQDLGSFIHNAWANEQLKGKDIRPALGFYRRMRERVTGWEMPGLESELAIAESVILDEGAEDRAQALAVVEAAIRSFGKRPQLIRQRSKVLRHQGENDAAASALIEIEDAIGGLPPFDQGLALRDGAVAAADAGRHDDALRLLGKANTVFAAKGTHQAMCAGLTVDEALVLWDQGRRAEALRRAGDALEAVEAIDPSASLQNRRAHLMVRAAVKLFLYDVDVFPRAARPAVKPGMGSQLENSDRPEAADFEPLADDWRMLEMAEVEAGVEAGVAMRAQAKQTTSRSVVIETNLARAHFARALEAMDIDGALRAIAPAISLRKRLTDVRNDGHPYGRADVADLAPRVVSDLIAAGSGEATQGALVDIMLIHALAGRWSADAAQELRKSLVACWGSDDLLKPLLDAASGATAVDGSMPMCVLVAFTLMSITDGPALTPRDRALRDLYWVCQTATSSGRRALEPVVVKAMADGWRYVLGYQRFALSMPMRSAPAIEGAIKIMEQQGIRAAPELIYTAAQAAGVVISQQWREFLSVVAGNATPAE